MAALSQTAVNCHLYSNSVIELVQAGEAMTIGNQCYLKAADSKYYKGSNTGSAEATTKGMVSSPVPAADVYFVLCKSGSFNPGATMAVGELYTVGVAGAIIPDSDLATGNFPTTLGRAKTASELPLAINASGVAHA